MGNDNENEKLSVSPRLQLTSASKDSTYIVSFGGTMKQLKVQKSTNRKTSSFLVCRSIGEFKPYRLVIPRNQ